MGCREIFDAALICKLRKTAQFVTDKQEGNLNEGRPCIRLAHIRSLKSITQPTGPQSLDTQPP